MVLVNSPVEEIKNKLDIAEVIGEYIPLKPAGPERLKARCPFHNERTPSFMVSRYRQIFHCFGCGEGGDLITFVQKMEGLEFPEALRLLAKKANVQLPQYDPKLTTEKTALLDVLKIAAAYYHEYLLKAQAARSAREYLSQARKLKPETLEIFKIGYAPDAWDGLTLALKKRGISEAYLISAGVSVRREKGEGVYDRFRNRIMFPIRDVHGSVIGFGGRALAENEPAKYINTPQTLVYNKSQVLYNLDLAKPEIRKQKIAIVVEGYMDCVASYQAGVGNVVAASGTALTEGQVLLLKRFASTAALAFDMDPAGENAAKRGITQAWKENLEVKVISLPFGKDPDECINKDPKAWHQAVAAAQPILEFYFSRTLGNLDPKNVQDKKAAAKVLLPILSWVTDPIEQTHYLQKLAEWLRVEENLLRRKLTPQKSADEKFKIQPSKVDRQEALSQRLLGLLQLEPSLIPEIAKKLPTEALNGAWQNLYKFVQLQYSEDNLLNISEWQQAAAKRDPSLADGLAISAMAVADLSAGTSVEKHREIETVTQELQRVWFNKKLIQLTQELRLAESRGDKENVQKLTSLFQELTQKFKQS
ncbi:DNA primase [Candidatus Parcubacteria bacterium]|jgi:DNA primase|nr:MAG: DNA primase [Candidatus Parcubacteria bacterium]